MPTGRVFPIIALSMMVVLPAVSQTSQEPAVSAADKETGGPPLIRSFTPKTYHAATQNWAATQDTRGVLYFANTDCVLEYDGIAWRRIPMPNGSVVRSIAVDGKGRVYAGGQGDFGYLEADAQGLLKYHSLLGTIPRDAGKFGDIWSIIPTREGIYFGAYQAIFFWEPGAKTVRVWKHTGRFGRLMHGGIDLFVTAEQAGLLRLRAGRLEAVPGAHSLERSEVRNVFERGDAILVVTQKGLLEIKGGAMRKLNGGIERILGEGAIYSATQIRNGLTVLATTLNGVLFTRDGGTIEGTIAKENGLLSNSATSLLEDREGGLWITSSSGLDRADLAMTRFAEAEGLRGATYGVTRHEGRIFAGTDQGLFSLRSVPRGGVGFEPISGIQGAVYATISTRHGLVTGGPQGLYSVAGATVSKIPGLTHIYDIATSLQSHDRIYVATRNGLNLLRWDRSKWMHERAYPSAGEDFRSALEDSDGRVWVATQKDVLRVDWRGPEGLVERFGADRGVPSGFKNIYRIRGEVVFATPKGVLKFEGSKFVPWNVLGKEFGDGARPVSIIREVADGRVWITGEGYHGELRPKASGGWDWRAMPLGRADLAELYAVLPEADGTVWAAGTDGFLVRYSPKQEPPGAPFGVLVRRVQSQGGPVVYQGTGDLSSPPRIGYRNNSLRIEYAAPYMQDPLKVEYQLKLEGADSDWSGWSLETTKDYTHLLEGSYRFLVRARNPVGVLSQSATFSFSISPPWFRTWPAYLFYLLSLVTGIWGLLKWRVSKLEAEKASLEQTVEERTVEIREQRDQIQNEQEKSQTLLLNILPSSVAEELKKTGTVQPQHYPDVTVCFTDFAGFTLSSEGLPAGHLVSALHEYFTVFDEIVEEFGLEKLKTIGDAYMLVSGLPRPRRAHAVDAVLAALRMVEAVEELATRGEGPVWEVRVGLHSGPVAAGVVGVRKFAFDIWGNTVNLASRMESSGSVGRVNLSEDTWSLVSEFIQCEERGAVQTKDKRDLRMYFAVGVKPELRQPGAFTTLYAERFGEMPGYEITAAGKVVI